MSRSAARDTAEGRLDGRLRSDGLSGPRRSAVHRASAVPDPAAGMNSTSALVTMIARLEELSAMLSGLQALAETELRRRRIQEQAEARVPREQWGRDVADEVALARRMSPKRVADQLAVRRVLVESMPQVMELLLGGRVHAWTAEQVARIALVLDDEDRAELDREIAPRLPEMSTRAAVAAARRAADRLDQQAALRRLAGNEAQRCVSIRAVADGMVRLSALLPTRDGIAVYAALKHAADTAYTRQGTDAAAAEPGTDAAVVEPGTDAAAAEPGTDAAVAAAGGASTVSTSPRSRGQIMADTLVERVTGSERAQAVPIEIHLLMTDRTLLAGGTDPGAIDGIDIPAPIARHLALGRGEGERPHRPQGSAAVRDKGAEAEVARFIRRLYTDPVSGEVTDYDTRRRSFTGAVRGFILARDQRCRVPYCDAPIRQIDHVYRYAEGGRTRVDNGVGLCARHNLTREQPGWAAHLGEPGSSPGRLTLTTPAGQICSSDPPDLHVTVGPPIGSEPRTRTAPAMSRTASALPRRQASATDRSGGRPGRGAEGRTERGASGRPGRRADGARPGGRRRATGANAEGEAA